MEGHQFFHWLLKTQRRHLVKPCVKERAVQTLWFCASEKKPQNPSTGSAPPLSADMLD